MRDTLNVTVDSGARVSENRGDGNRLLEFAILSALFRRALRVPVENLISVFRYPSADIERQGGLTQTFRQEIGVFSDISSRTLLNPTSALHQALPET